jgi:outer membrane protein assembly factor BamB
MISRTLLVLSALAASIPSLGADWPQFRGPAASGIGQGAPVPTTWNVETGENVRWQTPIPGLAHAAPIVWGDCVYVATAVKPGGAELKVGLYGNIDSVNEKESHQWRLLALDKATGAIVWNTLGHEAIPRVKRHTKASHCNSTPATDGRRIVALFGSEGLFCFDMKGALLWKKDLGPMDSGYFDVPSAQWGFASSPILVADRVIVQCDVQKGSFIAAFDAADGREVWRTARSDVPTWSTPALVGTPGRRQLVVNGWHHTAGYELATGKQLWRLDGGGDIPVPTPVFAHGLIYLTSAHGKVRPMRAVRPDASGDITPPEIGATNAAIAWVHPRQGNYMQTPLVVGDHLFGCFDNGVLTCFDAHSGAIQYSERLTKSGQGFTASGVASGDRLFFPSELGDVFVVAATNRFQVLATNIVGETCMASPAISDGTLFLRTRTKLLALGAK